MLKIHSIETFGTHDGPGIRLIIFTQGCNMKCLYCHNVDTQSFEAKKELSTKEILELLEKQRAYFSNNGGLTISGGEPLMQAKAVAKILKKAKQHNFNTVLDTNGSILTSDSKKAYDNADLILFDVKHINNQWHQKITGINNDTTLASIKYREDSKKPMWLRYVLVPGYTDQEESLIALGEYFKDYQQIEKIEILPYHNFGVYKYHELGITYELESIKTPTIIELQKVKLILNKYFKEVIIK